MANSHILDCITPGELKEGVLDWVLKSDSHLAPLNCGWVLLLAAAAPGNFWSGFGF